MSKKTEEKVSAPLPSPYGAPGNPPLPGQEQEYEPPKPIPASEVAQESEKPVTVTGEPKKVMLEEKPEGK